MNYSVENGNDICMRWFNIKILAVLFCFFNKRAKEVFRYHNNELVGCIYSKKLK